MKPAYIVGIIGVIVVAVIAWIGLSGTALQPKNDGMTQSNPDGIPALTLSDYEGNSVNLEEFKGKPLVLNSWATWCPFCVRELPDFAAAQEEFGEDVLIVAINREESLATSREYSDDLEISDDLLFLLDPDDAFYGAIGGNFMPETIFVDKQGSVVFHKRGPMDLKEIRERIQSIIL